tara:strand:- start:271 stop:546 length:276 start_codon:yes stop_codon:yes gene_type:complete
MSEETEQKEEEKPQETQTETNTNPMIEEAKKAAEDLRNANEERKKLLDREEKILAEKALGGKSVINEEEEKTEETPAEYAKRVMAGELGND